MNSIHFSFTEFRQHHVREALIVSIEGGIPRW